MSLLFTLDYCWIQIPSDDEGLKGVEDSSTKKKDEEDKDKTEEVLIYLFFYVLFTQNLNCPFLRLTLKSLFSPLDKREET